MMALTILLVVIKSSCSFSEAVFRTYDAFIYLLHNNSTRMSYILQWQKQCFVKTSNNHVPWMLQHPMFQPTQAVSPKFHAARKKC